MCVVREANVFVLSLRSSYVLNSVTSTRSLKRGT